MPKKLDPITSAKMKAKVGDIDENAKEYSKTAAGRFKEGTFTATDTGAKRLAKERLDSGGADFDSLKKSVLGTMAEYENYVKSGKYKKGGK